MRAQKGPSNSEGVETRRRESKGPPSILGKFVQKFHGDGLPFGQVLEGLDGMLAMEAEKGAPRTSPFPTCTSGRSLSVGFVIEPMGDAESPGKASGKIDASAMKQDMNDMTVAARVATKGTHMALPA